MKGLQRQRADLLLRARRAFRKVPWLGVVVGGVLGTLALSVLETLLFGSLGTIGTGVVVAVVFAIIIGGIFFYDALTEREKEDVPPQRFAELPVPTPYRGLVLLVSNMDVAKAAIEHHRPQLEHGWLITTQSLEQEKHYAATLIALYPDIALEARLLVNEYESEGTRRILEGIYRDSTLNGNLRADEIITNITGGTKTMTVGAFYVCQTQGYPIQYMPPIFDTETKRPIGSGKPVLVSLHSTSPAFENAPLSDVR